MSSVGPEKAPPPLPASKKLFKANSESPSCPSTSTIHRRPDTSSSFFPVRKILLLCGVGAVVIGAALWTLGRAAQLQVRSMMQRELEMAQSYVSKGEWGKAHEILKSVLIANDWLGPMKIEQHHIEQLQRETKAYANLSETALFEILEEAEQISRTQGLEAWQQRVNELYRSQWFIIEGELLPENDLDSKNLKWTLQFPVTIGDRKSLVKLVAQFPLAVGLSDASERARYSIFAAQFEDCELNAEDEWVVRFLPETAFFWENIETYRETNLSAGSILTPEQLSQILDRQSDWMKRAD